MKSFAAATVTSWTGVNTDSQQELSEVPKKGVRSCPCLGEILSVHGKYGWIKPLKQINHQDAWKHEGRIYLKVKDMRAGETACAGATVQFFLYADRAGLGAEDCIVLEQKQSKQQNWQNSWQQKSWQQKSWKWNKWEPSWKRWESSEPSMQSFNCRNPWNESAPVQPLTTELLQQATFQTNGLSLCARMQLSESVFSDDSTSVGDSASDVEQAEFVARPPPGLAEPDNMLTFASPFLWPCASKGLSDAHSEDDSTSAGDSCSDVDRSEFMMPPPGLELLPLQGISPPPGLELCA